MKVKIGKYVNWFGPFQLAEALCFWVPEKPDEYGLPSKPDWVHEFGKILAFGFKKDENKETYLSKFLSWVHSKKKRTVRIYIDEFDTWNMDSTLAMIILPMLKQLKETKHGSPFVDDEDVPEHIRSTSAKPKENEWDTDEFHHERWSWVLDEMIWAFEQMQPGCNWESDYRSESLEMNVEEGGKVSFFDKNYKVDYNGMKAHNHRIDNGTRLFGKYYRGLWD